MRSPIPPTMRSMKDDEEIITNVSNFIRNQDVLNGNQPRIRRPGGSQTPDGNSAKWPKGRDPISVIESMSNVNLNSPPVGGTNLGAMEQLTLQESSVSKIKEGILKRHFSDFRSGSRSIFAMICIVYAFYQMGVTTITYFEYRTGVAVKEEDIVSLEASLPGLTVCNKNLIEKSSAFNYMSGFAEAIRFQLGEDAAAVTPGGEYEAEMKVKADPVKFKKLIEVYEDFMSTYYAQMSVSRQLQDGPNLDKFLKYLDCNRKGFPDFDPDKGEMATCPSLIVNRKDGSTLRKEKGIVSLCFIRVRRWTDQDDLLIRFWSRSRKR